MAAEGPAIRASYRRGLLLAAAILLPGCVHYVGTGVSTNPTDEVAELRDRVERLEKRNAELAQTSHVQETPAPQETLPQPKQESEGGSSPKMTASWQYGLVLESADGDFRAHVGGQAQVDFGWVSASQAVQFGPGGTGQFSDGALLRRAVLRMDGVMYRNIEWAVHVGFTGTFNNDNTPDPE